MRRLEQMKLDDAEMKRISGGTWDYDTVSDEDREELDRIIDMLVDEPDNPYGLTWLHEYADRMDAKYGPNPPLC